jgi:hypothetical protein
MQHHGLDKSLRGSHDPEDTQSLPPKGYLRPRFPGVNPEKTVSATTTVLVYLRNNPKVHQIALNPPGDADKRALIAINFKAG